MIHFNDLISDETLAAYIDGNSNGFESMKIDSYLSESTNLSEIIDIIDDIKVADLESLPIDNNCVELLTNDIKELNNKIK